MTDDARRYAHLGSALTLLRLIRLEWLSLAELSRSLDLSVRSVRRLLSVLRAQGVPIMQRSRAREGRSPCAEYRTDVEV